MLNRSAFATPLVVILGLAVLAANPVTAQTCEPLNNGRIADVFYEGTAIYWDPVVEYTEVVLTISGPCEDIVKKFGPKDQISFDIREIERVTDGQYTWELRRVAPIDPGVQEDITAARGSGEEDAVWWNYFQKGAIPEGPYTDSESFAVVRGEIITPGSGEEKTAALEAKESRRGSTAGTQAALAAGFGSPSAPENSLAEKYTISGDLTVYNSLCVGFDCPSNPTYSDSTILLTENNTRIKFDDTSTANSFPRNDWEIQANSNANGGGNWLGFNDCGENGGGADGGGCADDLVFAVEAGVRQHALYVENSGEVGFGTNSPVLELHTVAGDTPGLRLEQDASNGFAPQVWDIAGNETNFFVRDVSNGSTLPFRIRPGADSSSIFIDTDSSVGIGTSSPAQDFHVTDRGDSNSNTAFRLSTSSHAWDFATIQTNGAFRVSKEGTGSTEFNLSSTGDLTITGEIFTNGSCSSGCDRVFSPVYDLESIEEHAELMWTNSHLPAVGPTPEEGPFNLSQKTLGILNELEKAHIYISQLNSRLHEKEGRLAEFQGLNEDLRERQSRLEEELAELKKLVRNLGGSE